MLTLRDTWQQCLGLLVLPPAPLLPPTTAFVLSTYTPHVHAYYIYRLHHTQTGLSLAKCTVDYNYSSHPDARWKIHQHHFNYPPYPLSLLPATLYCLGLLILPPAQLLPPTAAFMLSTYIPHVHAYYLQVTLHGLTVLYLTRCTVDYSYLPPRRTLDTIHFTTRRAPCWLVTCFLRTCFHLHANWII